MKPEYREGPEARKKFDEGMIKALSGEETYRVRQNAFAEKAKHYGWPVA